MSLVFPERHHLVEFSPVMKVSFRLTKRRDFYTHYFIEIPVYVLISRYFIWKSIIWRLSSRKTIILRILLIRVLNYFLINCIHLKLLFRMDLKEMFLLKELRNFIFCIIPVWSVFCSVRFYISLDFLPILLVKLGFYLSCIFGF